MGAVSALLRGYALGGFGAVYPMTRASSVLLVLPLGAMVAGEWPTPTGLIGVALVSFAVMVLALRQRKDKTAGGVATDARMDPDRCRVYRRLHRLRCARRAAGAGAAGLRLHEFDRQCRPLVVVAASWRDAPRRGGHGTLAAVRW
jgi:hypothetical protein